MYGIGPKLPVKFQGKGIHLLTQTIEENTQQNLKNLLLTAPGERVMDANFGVGLRNFLFQNNTPTARTAIESRIYEQVDRYMPFVRITELQVMDSPDNPSVVDIMLRYDIANVASEEILSLSLDPKITF